MVQNKHSLMYLSGFFGGSAQPGSNVKTQNEENLRDNGQICQIEKNLLKNFSFLDLIHQDRESSVIRPLLYLQAATSGF